MKFKLNKYIFILSCMLALFPCMFNSLLSNFSGITIVIIYILALFFAFISQNSTRIKIKKCQKNILIIWCVILVLCIFNRNGDIINGKYIYVLNMMFIIIYSSIFLISNNKCLFYFFMVLIVYLLIHVIFGFYFLYNPDFLLNIGSELFKLSGVWYKRFLSQVRDGAFMGLTSHYSVSAMYMSLGFIIFTANVLTKKKYESNSNRLNVILFFIFFVALILTQKRGHLLFCIITFILMYFVGFISNKKNTFIKQILLFTSIICFVFFIFIQVPEFQVVLSRFTSSSTIVEASNGRISELWIPAFNLFLKNPFFGVGWRQFKYLSPMYTMGSYVNDDVHNIYLQLLCENGIIGFIIVFGVMITSYIITWKLIKKAKYTYDSYNYFFVMFSFGYQTFFLLYGLTGNSLYDIQCFFPYIVSCCIAFYYWYDNSKNFKLKKVLSIYIYRMI